MKGTFGAINAFLIASALAGSAFAADPAPAPTAGTTAGPAQSAQPAGDSAQAKPKHKHHMGMHHDKAKKQDSNG
jgi:hypothetical protein